MSDAITMDMIGHNSRAVSQNYTHIEEEAKRKALALLPDVTAVATRRETNRKDLKSQRGSKYLGVS